MKFLEDKLSNQQIFIDNLKKSNKIVNEKSIEDLKIELSIKIKKLKEFEVENNQLRAKNE